MNDYRQIFKRKSFHLFRDTEVIPKDKLRRLDAFIAQVTPLYPSVRTAIRIVPESETSCKRGAEYCILFYSETEQDYLRNIGYIGEQIDLYLASENIGALWYGAGKPQQMQCDGLDFIIMIAIAGAQETQFRQDMFKAKRKPLDEVWTGDTLGVGEIARFAPSACNTQPWFTENSGEKLLVSRYTNTSKRGIMPADKVSYYNRIDIGIFLFILETCLRHEGCDFARRLLPDCAGNGPEMTPAAEYRLKTGKQVICS